MTSRKDKQAFRIERKWRSIVNDAAGEISLVNSFRISFTEDAQNRGQISRHALSQYLNSTRFDSRKVIILFAIDVSI